MLKGVKTSWKERYYKWIRLETPICKIFQSYIEKKRSCKSFLEKRKNKQAPIDFLGRLYDKETNETIVELAVEVRSLDLSKEDIEERFWYIGFPKSKLNEMMKFWRMDKECYIVYSLAGEVFFLSWDYYLRHNFELVERRKGDDFLKLPMRSFMRCGVY